MERKLIDYYPDLFQEFREIKVLSETEQREVELLEKAQEWLLADQYITTSTETGIARWEKILGILPKISMSLEDRRFAILTRLSQELPYSMGMLRRQMDSLCGAGKYTIELRNQEYLLIVRIALLSRNSYGDVSDMLRNIVPANIVIDLSLLYNRHNMLKTFTHRQLNAFTHYGIRNEVKLIGRSNE